MKRGKKLLERKRRRVQAFLNPDNWSKRRVPTRADGFTCPGSGKK